MGSITDVIFMIVLPLDDPYGMLKISYLGESQVKGEKDTCPKKEEHKPGMSANIAIQPEEEIINALHGDRSKG